MGRPEQPIADDAPFGDLALVLREIRNGTELTLEVLADRIGCTPSSLSKAAAGSSLPGERLLRAWARECGQPERADELCQLRSKHKQQPQRKSVSKTKPGRPRKESTANIVKSWPDPRKLHTPEQVMDALRALRVMPPLLTYSALERMIGWPKSTVHDVLQRVTLPRYELYMDFLIARRITDSEEWRAAYARAELEQERRRREHLEQEAAEVQQPPEALETPQPAPDAGVHEYPDRTTRKLFARWRRNRKPDDNT
jgi:transcriptional regulator with XRE-family HTH domain